MIKIYLKILKNSQKINYFFYYLLRGEPCEKSFFSQNGGKYGVTDGVTEGFFEKNGYF